MKSYSTTVPEIEMEREHSFQEPINIEWKLPVSNDIKKSQMGHSSDARIISPLIVNGDIHIMNQSDALLVYFKRGAYPVGTSMELMWAYNNKKFALSIIDLELGTRGFHHPWINYFSSAVMYVDPKMEDIYDIIKMLQWGLTL